MNLVIDILSLIAIALIPAAFSFFLDYALGHPMSNEPSTKAIFSFYSLYLSKKALTPGKLHDLKEGFLPMLNNSDIDVRMQGEDQLNRTIILEGQKYFTYQQALGMCPFCTNFWIALFVAVVCFFSFSLTFMSPVFFFIAIPTFSHCILRKL